MDKRRQNNSREGKTKIATKCLIFKKIYEREARRIIGYSLNDNVFQVVCEIKQSSSDRRNAPMHPQLVGVELFVAQSACDLGACCGFAVLVLHYLAVMLCEGE